MNKRIVQTTFGLMVLVAGTFSTADYFLNTQESYPSVPAVASAPVSDQSEPAINMFSSSLNQELDTIIAKRSNLEVAVSLVDLDTGNQYASGETDVIFLGASTTKLVTAVAYLREVDEGNATLTQTIDGVEASQLLKQMIEDSDNDAWSSLMNYLGSTEQDFSNKIGLASYTQEPYHTISSSDMVKLLTLLYKDELVSVENKELLLSYMEEANYSELIKSALPSEATVYHKYGTLYGNLHDTAIVTYQGRSFALVIFTKNSDNTLSDYDKRVDLIHEITQTVLNNLRS